MSDLPDYTKQTSINQTILVNSQMIPRPLGVILAKGSVTTAAAYATIATYTVTNLKQLQLAKIVISAKKALWFKYRWNGVDISCERYMDDATIVFEHFPWAYKDMVGNGVKAFDVQVKQDTSADTANCEIMGDEYAP